MTPVCRVLIVEDYKPFRRAIGTLLRQRADLVIVGEAADGFDAIQQAQALRPDLILLDIGLPGMNGFEVAPRIREFCSNARMVFVTHESSLDVIEEAFARGADGYVSKLRVQADLLPGIDTILGGSRFASCGLQHVATGDVLASHRHDLLFSSSDAVLVAGLSRFIATALAEGSAVVVLVTDTHEVSLHRRLRASHVDLHSAVRQGRYIPLNIGETLSKVMVNGSPDPTRFLNSTGDLLHEALRRATGRCPKVAACGECAPTLWAQGEVDAAIQLEHLWDEASMDQDVDILCAYPISVRDERTEVVKGLCAEHTFVEIC
jgi:DNA-binding NarL/FixJ family response regulator